MLRVFVKGSLDRVLPKSVEVVNARGEKAPFTMSRQEDLLREEIKPRLRKGLKGIALAYKDIRLLDFDRKDFSKEEDAEFLEKGLTLSCIIFLREQIASGVLDTVAAIKKAGLTLRMVTRENAETARATAREVGILTNCDEAINQYACMDGRIFHDYVGGIEYQRSRGAAKQSKITNILRFREIIPQLRVLPRASPEDVNTLLAGLNEEQRMCIVTLKDPHSFSAYKKQVITFTKGKRGS